MFLKFLLLGLTALVLFSQPCLGTGKIEIKMKRYQSFCRDNFGVDECDTCFTMCIEPGNVDIRSCSKKFGPTTYYKNTNNITFYDKVGDIKNPLIVTVNKFETNQVTFFVTSFDKEPLGGFQRLATMVINVSYTTATKNSEAVWQSAEMYSGSYRVWFDHRSYCDAYYYTRHCDVYCEARDDSEGHYTCNERTGEKKCMRGWKGSNCSTDINECEQGPCYSNAECQNLPGTYKCVCSNGFMGQNCNLIDSLCRSSPCHRNCTCSGNMTTYTCSCPVEPKRTDSKAEGLDWVAIAVPPTCVVFLAFGLIAFFFIRRRRQKKEMAARLTDREHREDVVQVVSHDNMACGNAPDDNSVIDQSTRQQMPVHAPTSTTPPDDPTHLEPVNWSLVDERTEPKGVVGRSVLDTRTLASGGEDLKSASNPYSDFEDLRRRAMAAKQAAVANRAQMGPSSLERLEQAEKSPDHDLDDCLTTQNNANGTSHFNRSAASSSRGDLLASDDAKLTRNAPGYGYVTLAENNSQREEPEHLRSMDEEGEVASQ